MQASHVADSEQLPEHERAVHAPQPTALVDPGAHSPCPVQPLHPLHVQVPRQVRRSVPHIPHGRDSIAPEAHSRDPMQSLNAPHSHCDEQTRVRAPQNPQASVPSSPGMQVPASTPHARHEPDTQESVASHGVPAQHASPTPPQGEHTSAAQRRPLLQPPDSQHGSPSRPHVPHIPSRHTKMPSHVRPVAQHG